ncbi:MAG: IS21 family transposase [Syntrophobacterales bacterium]|nr:IS21 family transposase [Syntrophobacterales bacterium]
MVDKNSILIMYYRDEKSKSSISRELKISRKTVRSYIRKHEQKTGTYQVLKHLEKGLSSRPEYDVTTRKKVKLTEDIEEEIENCLKQNKQKINQGLRKQVMKKIDIYEYLLSKGYDIGYTTICNYIRKKEELGKESFIKQIYKPGEVCEFDWGDVKLFIDGKLQTFNMAVFTSAYNNYRWAKLFHRQDTLAFSQSHIDFFSHIQGVHKELVYDNMRVAIAKFVGRTEKQPTEALLELSNYYKFRFRFCNIRKGNEKGHVEKSVEYVRRKSFCIKDKFSNITEANKHLQKSCDKLNNTAQQLLKNKTANDLFKEEKLYLYESEIPYKSFKDEYAKVDKYSTIILYGNRYSVPDFLVGKLLDVRVFAEKIDVYYNAELVCTHVRSYGAHTWSLDINHYLTTLFRKPGALKGSMVFSQLSCEIKNIYKEYFIDESKDFIELLQYCKNNEINFETVEKAIKKVKQITPTNISKDKILSVIDKEKEPVKKEKRNNEIYHHSQTMLKELSVLLD